MLPGLLFLSGLNLDCDLIAFGFQLAPELLSSKRKANFATCGFFPRHIFDCRSEKLRNDEPHWVVSDRGIAKRVVVVPVPTNPMVAFPIVGEGSDDPASFTIVVHDFIDRRQSGLRRIDLLRREVAHFSRHFYVYIATTSNLNQQIMRSSY